MLIKNIYTVCGWKRLLYCVANNVSFTALQILTQINIPSARVSNSLYPLQGYKNLYPLQGYKNKQTSD